VQIQNERFGELLKRKRLENKATLEQMEGFDAAELSRWESGNRKPPERPVVVRLCRALGLDLESADGIRLLAAAERERYKDLDESYLLDFRRYRDAGRRGPSIGRPRSLSETASRAGRHVNPIIVVENDLEFIESIIHQLKRGGTRVMIEREDGLIQDIVRSKLSTRTLEASPKQRTKKRSAK
jgi:transcriptional regulator with XRE-family HTH domain